MKILCIGKNYKTDAADPGIDITENIVFFMKPETALIKSKLPFYYPEFSKNIHCDAELVLRICRLGKHISERFAHTYYNKITVGVSFTAIDVLEKCKKDGLPWEIAKAFDGSAAVGSYIDKNEIKDLSNINFSLKLNNKTIRKASSDQMNFSFDKLISYISKFVTLKIGDLIFTGMPAGVGEVQINDLLEAYFDDKKCLEVKVK